MKSCIITKKTPIANHTLESNGSPVKQTNTRSIVTDEQFSRSILGSIWLFFCVTTQANYSSSFYLLKRGHLFQQFEQALITDQKELLLDEPLTSEDCRFLKSIALPFSRNSTRLDLSSFTKEDIQGYGIVFKVLSGMDLSSIQPSLIHPKYIASAYVGLMSPFKGVIHLNKPVLISEEFYIH